MKRLLPFALVTLLTSIQSYPQEPDPELRAVWLTSVFNIDWPNNTLPPSAQKNRLRNILNILQENNINAVLFQVRPSADALYQSAYDPWSQWITGTRGQVPSYDPLALIIEEAHKRGIEVHAWLNPYRFEMSAEQYAGLPGDYSRTHPELIFTHKNRTYFDPGNPGTTQLIKNIITDLVTHYNIDGVVFDDYFYPSGMTLRTDQKTFDTYASHEFVQQWYPDLTRGNFRRASVNNMIREVNHAIKSIKPHMVFGVSPAGIYSTQASAAANWGTTLPTGISGKDNYNVIYCDPLAWLHDGSVDYISPQLYWVISGNQDFITLNQWWGYQAKRHKKHHFPSLASYKLYSQKDLPFLDMDSSSVFLESLITHFVKEENDKYNWPVTEIENQIIANRNNPYNLAQGLMFFSTNTYINGIKNLARYLANDLFSEKSVIPDIPWLTPTQPGSMQLAERADRFLLNEREQLLANADSANHLASVVSYTGYQKSTQLNAPADGTVNINLITTMQWNTVSGVNYYHIQVATDSLFNDQYLVVNHEIANKNIYTITLEQPNTRHYARVRIADACGNSVWSAVNSFTTGKGTFVEDDRPHVLRVSPNPVHETCMVNYPVAVGERTIQWFTTHGKLLDEEVRKNITISDSFDLTKQQPGLYTVQIQTENQEKFIFRVLKSNRAR